MKKKQILFLLFLLTSINCNLLAKPTVDVLSYHVYLETNVYTKQVKGSVIIKFQTDLKSHEVSFDSGNLIVTDIKGNEVEDFEQKGEKVFVSIKKNVTSEHEIKVFYEGMPRKGMVFQASAQQLYTVYFTSEWMVCNSSPDDRAKVKIDILISDKLVSIASGELIDIEKKDNGKTLYSWSQNYETPTYTYGIVVGSFNESHDNHNGIALNYYAANHSSEAIEKIFNKTGDMISFFEDKAGVPYPQKSYSQVLIGNHFQEMSGFAVLKNTYGDLVLKDSTETNLISHELAHQWWGNMITCKSWNHMWLNEGFATFMSAAYNEYRFGKKKYQENIDAYFSVYDNIKKRGGDRSLVFTDWDNPSKDDRNLVYFKAAYVLHMLRIELGDEDFWKGIKYYTQEYYGKSVVTKDFQMAMEKSSNRKLEEFFNYWVYKNEG